MRVGDKSKKLNFDERMQLLYDKGERYYEDKDVYGATIDDVDMNLVGDYMNVIGYGKSGMEFLRENNDFFHRKRWAAEGKYSLHPTIRKESPAFLPSCPHSLHPL